MRKKIWRRLQHVLLVLGLVAGPIYKIKASFVYVTLSIKRWTGLRPVLRSYVRLPIEWNGYRFDFYVRRQLDFDVLKDTFAMGIYNADIKVPPTVIVDLGSNIGTTAIKYLLLYPQAHVYAFEPDPANLESLRRIPKHSATV